MTEKPEHEETDTKEDTELKYSFEPVKAIPGRKYKKGSKYDPVLDAFLKSKEKLVKVTIPGRDANYIRTQLKKRLDARPDCKGVEVSVTNNIAFLEKK